MSTKSQTVTDTPTHTRSRFKAIINHVVKGTGYNTTVAGGVVALVAVAVAAVAFGAAAAIIVYVAVAGTAVVSKDTEDHANDISPTLAKTFNRVGFHAAYLAPLVLAAAAGVSAFNDFSNLPKATPQTSMAAKFYKVSGPANNNCQLEEATPSANGKRVFELQGNCKFVPSELEAK